MAAAGGKDSTSAEDDGNEKTTGIEGHIDVMSPYYIHASDSPGQIFVNELLHDGNYGEWVADMSKEQDRIC
ncbi:Retrovirus-related Pol polyprotein from transposon TNT 1-94 [Sesbania bispinosa]|nr:Retrovirus-related Pol polyprotein from transposon TNT 1-94 [Sesbania bispinosa]